ncbi:MAG TPA: rod-binding protein [Acidobacteriota bacterium]|nr:rod-binding protein [Acidobacteriota bacterium]
MDIDTLSAVTSDIRLKDAVQRPQASLEEMAQQFEAVFVAQVLKVMRESVGSSGLFEDAPGKDVHMSMLDQHLAQELVRQGGFGLAEQMRQHLEKLDDNAEENFAKNPKVG